MADLAAHIETLENHYMRAWAQGDLPALKSLTGSGFHLLVGSRPAAMLDRKSWLEAAGKRYVCSSYRFGDIYVRDLGSMALFASQLELKASLDGHDWSGRLWVTDLWRKGRIRRRWRLVERVLSRVEEDPQVPAAIKSISCGVEPPSAASCAKSWRAPDGLREATGPTSRIQFVTAPPALPPPPSRNRRTAATCISHGRANDWP